MDSREEQNRVDVRMTQHTWSPRLEVDGAPIPWSASVREFQKDRAGYIAEALEQPLLLPRIWTLTGALHRMTFFCP